MKLVIGSSQLGMKYGILKNKINHKEIKKIEKLIFNSKIGIIDTADSYGKSEFIIGQSKLRKLKIITKIKLPKNKKKIPENLYNWLLNKFINLKKKIKKNSIHAILLHNQKDLESRNGKNLLESLKKIKKKKIINNIGVSIYEPNDIYKICNMFTPDLIQIPFSIFDTRLLNGNLINFLKKNKIKIFVRSIFLQGLLLNEHKNLKIDKKLVIKINSFKKWCKEKKISYLKACIHFIKRFKKIDYIVVGFNDADQLKEIIKTFREKNIYIPNIFSVKNSKLIDPRNWS